MIIIHSIIIISLISLITPLIESYKVTNPEIENIIIVIPIIISIALEIALIRHYHYHYHYRNGFSRGFALPHQPILK